MGRRRCSFSRAPIDIKSNHRRLIDIRHLVHALIICHENSNLEHTRAQSGPWGGPFISTEGAAPHRDQTSNTSYPSPSSRWRPNKRQHERYHSSLHRQGNHRACSRHHSRTYHTSGNVSANTRSRGKGEETVPEPFLLMSDMEDLRKVRPVDLLQSQTEVDRPRRIAGQERQHIPRKDESLGC